MLFQPLLRRQAPITGLASSTDLGRGQQKKLDLNFFNGSSISNSQHIKSSHVTTDHLSINIVMMDLFERSSLIFLSLIRPVKVSF